MAEADEAPEAPDRVVTLQRQIERLRAAAGEVYPWQQAPTPSRIAAELSGHNLPGRGRGRGRDIGRER